MRLKADKIGEKASKKSLTSIFALFLLPLSIRPPKFAGTDSRPAGMSHRKLLNIR